VPDTLQPIIQAAQLLQARKTDEDVQSVCDMCDKLSMFQVNYLKIYADFEIRKDYFLILCIKVSCLILETRWPPFWSTQG
jgi:myosin-5